MTQTRSKKELKAPLFTVQEAEKIVRKMNDEYGAVSISLDVMPQILGMNSANSGRFLSKIASLRKMNLIESTGKGRIKISNLGRKLATPLDGEVNQARIEAVLSIKLMTTLSERYPAGNFPKDNTILTNLLQREYDVPPQHTKPWLDFIDSAIPILKLQEQVDDGVVEQEDIDEIKNKKDIIDGSTSYHVLSIPLSDRTFAKISLPQSMKKHERDMLKSIIDALIFNDDNGET